VESQGTASAWTLAPGPARAGLRRGPGVLALAVALAWPCIAAAEPKDPVARRHLEDGQAALGRDDYDGAIEAYEQALAIEREAKVLYLLGQAEFLRGDCRASVRYFKEVKTFEVSPAIEEAMRPYLAECAESLLESPETVPEPPPEPEPAKADEPPTPAPSPSPAARASDRPARRWYQDPLGDVLVVTGVLGAAAGAALLGVAYGRRTGAQSYAELEGAASEIRTFRIAGGATLGAGAALAIGGFIRWGVVARRGRAPRGSVGIVIDRDIAGVTIQGRF
jgi:tetratricopeptide (TPR) repeat protein